MLIRVEPGLPKSRPSLAPQMDGPLYLDEIVRTEGDLIRLPSPSHIWRLPTRHSAHPSWAIFR